MPKTTLDTRIVKTCEFCGTDFLCKQNNRKTCSGKCRSRLFRWRASLPILYEDAAEKITFIGEYANYEQARRGAINALLGLKKHLEQTLAKHKIQAVK